jgi:SulP family sulfate permease
LKIPDIPSALLASIVMVAVYDIIDYKQAIILWKTHRRDFALLLICFVATLAIGTLFKV